MFYLVCYINKKRIFNISDRAYVDLGSDCIDTESAVLGDCQFFTL